MLKTRVITAVILVAALLAALWLLPVAVNAAIFAAVTALGAWEWARLLGAGQTGRSLFPLVVLAGCLVLYLFPAGQEVAWTLASAFWTLLAPVWLARGWKLSPAGVGYALGVFLLLSSWSALVALLRYGIQLNVGPQLVLGAMAVVWIADIAAYFTGSLFGRHKLAPTISPGKTWEGAAGAILAVLALGVLLARAANERFHALMPLFLAALVLLTAVSIVGDLFESLLKRRAGVKDSSALVPGHGGVLDRIDSLLPTLPLAALMMSRSTL